MIRRYTSAAELGDILREAERSPGRRERIYILPSHANDEPMLDMLREDGSFFGERPRLWSWSDLYRALVPRERLRLQIDPPDHMLILRHVISSVIADLDERGVPVPSGARRRGLAGAVSSAIKELMLEGVSPDKVIRDRASDEGAPIAPDELLHMIYSDYLAYLSERSLADSAMLPSLAAEEMDASAAAFVGEHELIWIGFMSFTGTQRRLVKKLARLPGSAMRIYVPDTDIEGFTDAAVQLDEDGGILPSFSFKGSIRAAVADDRYDQYDKAAAYIASAVLSKQDVDAGVLVSSGMAPLMSSALEKYGLKWQVREEKNVSSTPIMRIPAAAWELYKQSWPMERTLALLTSPALGVQSIDMEAAYRIMPEGEDGWRDFLSSDRMALDAFDKLVSYCALLDREEGCTPAEIFDAFSRTASAEWASNIAKIAADHCELDEAVREVASAAVEAADKSRLIGELTQRIGDAGSDRLSGDDAAAYIASWAEEASGPFSPPISGAVKIYEGPPPVLVTHDVWVMTDADASTYPGPVKDDPLLSSDDRDRINAGSKESGEDVHLTTLLEKRMQKEALFRRLVCTGTSETILLRAAHDEDAREVRESSFIQPLRSSPRWPIEDVDSAEIASFQHVSSRGSIYRGEFPRAVSPSFDREKKQKVSPSRLDVWSACKYRFWLSSFVSLDDLDRVPDPSSPMSKGQVIHRIWDLVWNERKKGGAPIASILLDRWDDALADIAGEHPFVTDPRASIVMKELKSSMMSVASIQDDVEARAGAAGLVRADTMIETWLPSYELASTVYHGRADRIDVWDGAGAVIVDYKSGRAEKYKNSLQLGCYAAMLEQSGELTVAGACFIGHRDGCVVGAWRDPALAKIYGDAKKTVKSIDEAVGSALAAMQDIDQRVESGRFDADPSSKDSCKACPYTQICRRSEARGVSEREGGEDDDE